MTTELLIDGMLSGTGVRDAREGGYVKPLSLGLSASLAADLGDWQNRYEEAHFAGFPEDAVDELDKEGLSLASRAQAELGKVTNIGYFSAGRMMRLS